MLLLCTSDEGGGAAEACRRLLDALTAVGIEVRMLVVKKGTADERIASVADTTSRRLWAKAAFLLERLEIYLRNGHSRQHLFRVSTARWGCDIASHPWVKEADILHLHWINQGFLSLTTLKKLAALGKPVFSTLHDLWVATGICHL
ncbi:MAG: glycosyl transferase family 1, partial [Porphyromonadaceae bacterium]|nr:glycosyl transferase family 1 [Porphyromonadaceae bacterium]